MPDDVTELAELRDAVNNTRAILRGLQNHARAAVKLTADLEERLELYDNRLQTRQRQAQEAQQHDHQNPNRRTLEHARV